MDTIISIIILIFAIIWATRVETGINDIRKSVERIEQQLNSKKEKK